MNRRYLVLPLLLTASSALAVITAGPRQLITSNDYLRGNRAQYVGRWGDFLGTAISPRHFITATHLGNAGGGIFRFNNGTGTETSYSVTYAGSLDDLTIWRLNDNQPSFAIWSPLYTTADEAGNSNMYVLGRGTDKGAEIRLPNTATGQLRGYMWGAYDRAVSWGTNQVTETLTFDPPIQNFGGDFLYFEFNQGRGEDPSECMLSSGDSGGPVFLSDATGRIRLAGVNSLVDGNFSYTQSGPFFPAAIWDLRGFYVGEAGNSQLIPANAPDPVSPGSYATRIASRMSFIMGIIGPTLPPAQCGTADFNQDGDVGTDQDIEAFFRCLAGNCCPACFEGGADFNLDGDVGTDQDIESFFRVLAGGSC